MERQLLVPGACASARSRARSAAIPALGLLLSLAGCAGDPLQQGNIGGETPIIATGSDATVEAAAADPAPEPVPVPDNAPPLSDDLWQTIRDGLEMPENSERARVRRWVQFFASRPEHLQRVAENARPFLWHVVRELEARDLPLDLALLPIVESGYDPTAYSYARASGMWQFMPYTARRFGLDDNWWHDGRRDVLRSTDAALDYLEWLHGRYDDWALALAAYNAGEGRVDRALSRSDDPDYWSLDLPRETENYVPKLMAVRQILGEADRFAFEWPAVPNEPVTELVTLPGQIELAVAAEMMGMPESELQRLNPGVRRWATPPDGPHRLLVPSDRVDRLREAIAARDPDSLVTWRRHRVRQGEVLGTIAERYGTRVAVLREVNDLRGSLIRAGQYLLIPVGAEAGAPPPSAPSAGPSGRYTVANGDSLWLIAQRLGVTVAELREWNDLAPGAVIRPGQTLAVRGNGDAVREYRVRRGDSLWTIARRFDVRVAELRAWNGLTTDSVLRPGQSLKIRAAGPTGDSYRVRAGDSLWSIANRFQVAVEDLKTWNNIGDNTIRPGQRLRLRPG